jgi:putative ABC transport system substrate-binding protein
MDGVHVSCLKIFKGRAAALLGIGVFLFGAATSAQAKKKFSIGSLNTADQFINSFEGFRARMAELGYRDGQTVRYQYYNSRGNDELLKALAQKLAQGKFDLIVTSSTAATAAAAKATEVTRTPVLFLSAGNPLKLVKSFSSSGNNLAGISSGSLDLMGKRMELLRELAPKAGRVAMPVDVNSVNLAANAQEVAEAAARFGFKVAELKVASPEELEKLAAGIKRKDFDAIFMPADSMVSNGIDAIAKVAVTERLPLISSLLVLVKRGALASYAADYSDLGSQGAVLADKILRGARPASLPIELPRKYKLAINLKTARTIDLRIAKDLLLRADDVIE